MVIDLTLEEQMKLTQAAKDMQLSEADIICKRYDVSWFLALKAIAKPFKNGDDDFANGHSLSHKDSVTSFSNVLRHL